MDFPVACECGSTTIVSEGSAGACIPCRCGRTVDIPSLATLRTNAGLAAVELPLNIEVECLVKSGELPPAPCVGCGATGAEVVNWIADCERMYVHKSGGISWATLILTGLATGGQLFAWFESNPVLHGRETVIPVPARACDYCLRTVLRSPSTSMLNRLGNCCLALAFIAVFIAHWALPVFFALSWLLVRMRIANRQTEYQRELKCALCTVPVYKKIFDKYPDALVTTGIGG